MTKQRIKELLINCNGVIDTPEEAKNYLAYYIIKDLQDEIENKNKWRPEKEKEKAINAELINCGILNYYSINENIKYYENTEENRKELFTFESLLDFITRGKSLYNYSDWYIAYDMKNKKVLEITTASCILWHLYDKNIIAWLLENPKYYKNYDIYKIVKNLNSIICESLSELHYNYIICNCKLNEGGTETKQKIIFKKHINNFDTAMTAYTMDKKSVLINNIIDIDNKNVPLLKNAKNNDLKKLENDFIKDNFYRESWQSENEIKINNTEITLQVLKNCFVLNYKNNYYRFYKINGHLYQMDRGYNNAIYNFDIDKIIKGVYTKHKILKAISILEV